MMFPLRGWAIWRICIPVLIIPWDKTGPYPFPCPHPDHWCISAALAARGIGFLPRGDLVPFCPSDADLLVSRSSSPVIPISPSVIASIAERADVADNLLIYLHVMHPNKANAHRTNFDCVLVVSCHSVAFSEMGSCYTDGYLRPFTSCPPDSRRCSGWYGTLRGRGGARALSHGNTLASRGIP